MTNVVRRAKPQEWRELRALWMEAVQDTPTAFGTTYVDAAALADDVWRQRAAENAAPRGVGDVHRRHRGRPLGGDGHLRTAE